MPCPVEAGTGNVCLRRRVVTVRLLQKEDIPAVAALERACFGTPWSEKALEYLTGADAFGVVLTARDGTVLAYAGLTVSLDDGALTNVATAPAMRCRGLGEQVLRALIGEARRRGVTHFSLEVRESNLPALALYRKLGFTVAGKRPRFYREPVEAALVMTLDAPLPETKSESDKAG